MGITGSAMNPHVPSGYRPVLQHKRIMYGQITEQLFNGYLHKNGK